MVTNLGQNWLLKHVAQWHHMVTNLGRHWLLNMASTVPTDVHEDSTGSWNPSLWKTRANYLAYSTRFFPMFGSTRSQVTSSHFINIIILECFIISTSRVELLRFANLTRRDQFDITLCQVKYRACCPIAFIGWHKTPIFWSHAATLWPFIRLTHWPQGEVVVILKIRIAVWAIPVKLISVECHRIYLMRNNVDKLWSNNTIWWEICVNTGWGKDLLPDGTKPLPEPKLTFYDNFDLFSSFLGGGVGDGGRGHLRGISNCSWI